MNVWDADYIEAARTALAAADPALALVHSALPPIPWRHRQGGFSGLVKMVVEQQVSVASAAAIWARLEAGLGGVTPETILSQDEAALRRFGLSGPKARYAQGIANAQLRGDVNLMELKALGDDDAVAALTSIKGVGRWTAETYLMFCEGRLDMFPAGDIALQEALRMAEGADARLQEKALYARADAWRPYRGVAAHMLWAYYGAVKRGEIALSITITAP